MNTATRRPADLALPLAAVAAVVGLWWAVVALGDVPAYVLPSPAAVVGALAANPGFFARNAWDTLAKIAVGGGGGVAAGFALGALAAALPPVRRAVGPYVVALRVLPKIAVAPLLLLYLGTGFGTAVVLVALVAFFPMVVHTLTGLDAVPDRHRDLLRSVDAPPLATFLRVRLPYALPELFAGLVQAVTLAVVGALVAEWVVADDGLGFLIQYAGERVQTDVMVAALLVLVAEGLALYALVRLAERAVLRGRR